MAKFSDKFLLAIVIGILLLVGITFVAVLRMPAPSYQTEDTPQGVIHNYLLALQQEDYERAYQYLSPSLANYPGDLQTFLDDIHSQAWLFDINATQPSSFNIIASKTTGLGNAIVDVEFSRPNGNGLFDSGLYETNSSFRLMRFQDTWKITGGDYSFWYECWNAKSDCR